VAEEGKWREWTLCLAGWEEKKLLGRIWEVSTNIKPEMELSRSWVRRRDGGSGPSASRRGSGCRRALLSSIQLSCRALKPETCILALSVCVRVCVCVCVCVWLCVFVCMCGSV